MFLDFINEFKAGFEKLEMELFQQEMELFLLFPDFWSQNLFYKMFITFNNDTKTGFENRKWNYFSYFLNFDRKTSFTKCF